MARIPFRRLKTRTLPTLVQAKDCDRCGNDMAILAMMVYLWDSYNEHRGESYFSWRLKAGRTLGDFAEDYGDLYWFFHMIAVTWTPEVVAVELQLKEEEAEAEVTPELLENVETSEATLVDATPDVDEVESTRASISDWLSNNVLSTK